jgi:mitochondrial fission protein ELM1
MAFHRPHLVTLDVQPGVAPSNKPPVRIFLGTEAGQHRAERVFIYAIECVRDPARAYEIHLMKDLPGFVRLGWRTGFTNYRFAVPDLAGRQGRAIYNDVDQIYTADPAELFDLDLNGHGYLALSAKETSVMLIDCARMAERWNMKVARRRTIRHLLAKAAAEPGLWGPLDPAWNARDLEYVEGHSKLLHFTAMHTQPWQPFPKRYSYHRHPLAEIWQRLEDAADAEGYPPLTRARPHSQFAETAGADKAPAPTVWLLLGHRIGDNAQVLALGDALGWSSELKQLRHNWLHWLPNFLLGATTITMDRHRSSPLVPPWPDFVVECGKRSAPVARWIKERSNGRTRLVALGRPWAPLPPFDLVVTTAQFRWHLDRPNLLHNIAPLHGATAQRLRDAATGWAPRLAHLPRPWFALLVGGNSAPYRLDVETARRLGREASAKAAAGGSLLVTTSARTPPQAGEALFAAVTCPAYLYGWERNAGDNPYLAYLALADSLIVTCDSASMIAEACATGKAVALVDLPRRDNLPAKLVNLVERYLQRQESQLSYRGTPRQQGWLARLHDRLIEGGLFSPPRELTELHRALAARGLLHRFGEAPPPAPADRLDDVERAIVRVSGLIA